MINKRNPNQEAIGAALIEGEESGESQPFNTEEEIRARIAVSLDQAKAGSFALGSGKEALRRAFDTTLQDHSDNK